MLADPPPNVAADRDRVQLQLRTLWAASMSSTSNPALATPHRPGTVGTAMVQAQPTPSSESGIKTKDAAEKRCLPSEDVR